MQNEKTISIAGKIHSQLRYLRFRCKSRSHKRSKFSSKCDLTFPHLVPEEQLEDIPII